MFAVRTRPLGKNRTPTGTGGADSAPIQRTISNPSPGAVHADMLACDASLLKKDDEGASLAAACHHALKVLASPTKRSARARAFAEMDAGRSTQINRLSLDEHAFRCQSEDKG